MALSPTKGRGRLNPLVGGAGAAAILISLVAGFEGKRNDPYRDLAGIRTVCFGETRVPMRRYSDAECNDMLAAGLADFAGDVLKRNPELKGRPYQLIAATSLAYNIGSGAYNRSTVARKFSEGDFKGGCDAFMLFTKAGGRTVKGLVKRRTEEREICMWGLPR